MRRKILFIIILVIFISSLPIFTGCEMGAVSPVVSTGSGGPPPHAPAYGVRAKRRYNYYPDANAYFDPVRGVYFYMSGGAWKVGVNLPSSLRVRLGSFVSLDLDTDKPYIYNSSHKMKYPPGQEKKNGQPKAKGKKKWK